MSTLEEPWTVGRLLDWTAQHLAERGAEFPRLDSEVLLAHALQCRRIDLYTRFQETAAEDARRRFRELVGRRLEGCPVAYLVGRKEFFSLPFEVTPAVLIPRSESEFVVLEFLRAAKEMAAPQVLDIGTGAGNLAVAVAYQHSGALVIAVDLSSDALAVAGRNAARHGVSERIQFLCGDLYEPLPPEARFDFILSNPPYIAEEDMVRLPAGVRCYEPHIALSGGRDGYSVFDRLIGGARSHLKPGGHLFVEIGTPQHPEVLRRMAQYPEYAEVKMIFDGAQHPRVLCARLRA